MTGDRMLQPHEMRPGAEPKKKYGYFCPVCEKVHESRTCPTCPGVVLLKMVNYPDDSYWRKLS